MVVKWIYFSFYFFIEVVIRLEIKWKYLVYLMKLNLIGVLFNYLRVELVRFGCWENDGFKESILI